MAAPRRSARHATVAAENEPAPESEATVESETTTSQEFPSRDLESLPEARAEAAATTDATSSQSRPSVQRLDSISQRRSARPGPPSTSGGLKFQPKAVQRRSKEEREAQEEAEEAKRLAKVADSGPSVSGGRGRGGFRGGQSGWKNDRRLAGQATGPLGGPSHDPTSVQSRTKFTRGGGGFTASRSRGATSSYAVSSRVKKEAPTQGSRGSKKGKDPKVKREGDLQTLVPTDGESDSEDGNRLNIDHINLLTDDEADDPSAKGKGREASGRPPKWTTNPVRLDRHEHVERAVGVNTAASLTSSQLRQKAKAKAEAEGTLFLSSDDENEATTSSLKKTKTKGTDVEFLRRERKWKGVWKDDSDEEEFARIKDEPTEELAGAPNLLPVGTTKVSIKNVKDSSNNTVNALTGEITDECPTNRKRQRMLFKKQKFPLRTPEQMAEWKRYTASVNDMYEVLVPPLATPNTVDADGDVVVGDVEEDKKKGHTYMFQLPPVLPTLVVRGKSQDPDAQPISVPTSKSQSKAPVAAEPGEAVIKTDLEPTQTRQRLPNAIKAEDTEGFSGVVGNLTVYESGQCILTWGGVEHELNKQHDSEMLQEVVISDLSEVKKEPGLAEDDVFERNRTAAMGQIQGGFVLTPHWESLFEGL